MQDLKAKYAKAKIGIEQVTRHLQELPTRTSNFKSWKDPADFILGELNYDTLERLDRFLDFADQYDKDYQGNRKPTQTAEEVLALASHRLAPNPASKPRNPIRRWH